MRSALERCGRACARGHAICTRHARLRLSRACVPPSLWCLRLSRPCVHLGAVLSCWTLARRKESEKDAKRRAREAEREAKALAREEAEREAAEALAKAKQEEFEQWKGMFSVEGSGEEGASGGDDEGLLPRFVAYMREHKVSVLEELAPAFGLRVAEVVERVSALERMGLLSGVIDDRGKFIYITHEEMAAVAKYVQRKGRVRISTLAMESNKLIDLAPKKLEEDDDDADAQGDREGDAAAAAQPG